jgi:hypothetical protein
MEVLLKPKVFDVMTTSGSLTLKEKDEMEMEIKSTKYLELLLFH